MLDPGLVEKVFRLEPYEEAPPPLSLQKIDLRHIRRAYRLLRRRIVPLPEAEILKANRWLLEQKQQLEGVLPRLCELYVARVRPYAGELGLVSSNDELGPHSGELLFSGFQNFYGLVLVSACLECIPTEARLDVMFDYILLYLYVDHYLDDQRQPGSQKLTTLKAMFELVHDPHCREAPPRMQGLVAAYRRILEWAPQAQARLVSVFETEVVGTIFQGLPCQIREQHRSGKEGLGPTGKDPSGPSREVASVGPTAKDPSGPSREEYLFMCELKGARTALGAHAILHGDEYRWRLDLYRIGACVQLLDDMHDINIDVQAGINTIATFEIQRCGNLDRLMYYTLERIESISTKFNLVKTLLAHLATYIMDASPYIGRRFRVQMEALTHIRHSQGVDIVAMFEEWLRNLVGNFSTA